MIIIFVITIAIVSLTGQGRRLGSLVGLSGPPPVIESIVPNHPIDIIGNQPIAVQGRDFQNGLKLKVGFPNGDSGELSGAQIQKRKDDSTRFNILIDLNGNPGLYSLQVVNPDNQVSPRFTFQARHESVRPLISWIEPANVKKGVDEQLVAVYGSNFQHGVKVEVIQPNGDTSELRER